MEWSIAESFEHSKVDCAHKCHVEIAIKYNTILICNKVPYFRSLAIG